MEAGTGDLEFTRVGGRTVLTRALTRSPLKLLNPRNTGSAAWAFLATYGGGLVGGDAVSVRVAVNPGAQALIATQASTKVYRSGTGASQRLHARVADDSLLVVLPDPVTAFAGSRYVQDQWVDLDATANLVLVDWFTAGRMGSGERWRFCEYSSRTVVKRGARSILHEALSLSAEDGDLAARMDRFNCLAFAVATGPALRATAARLYGFLGASPVPRRSELLLSVAPVGDDGVLLRLAGRSTEQVAAALRQHLDIVVSLLGDDPWRRT